MRSKDGTMGLETAPGPLSPAWCPRFRKTGKLGKCQGRSCGDTETPHSQGRIRGSLAGKPGWEPITARFFSRGTQESLPSLLLNMQSSAEIILAKNTSHTPSPHRLSSGRSSSRVCGGPRPAELPLPNGIARLEALSSPAGRGGSAQACSTPLPFYLPVWAGGYFGAWFVWALLCLFGL